MKLTDLIIVFVIITLPFGLMLQIHARNMEQIVNKKVEMNHVLDTAVEDGVTLLVGAGDGKKISLNKDRCLESFYNTLYVNFGIVGDEYAKEKIKGYIPVIVIIDYDGFNTLASETFLGKDGLTRIKPVWQPKKAFSYTRDNFVYGFTIEDYVTVYNTDTGLFMEGKQKDLKGQIADSLLQDETLFDEVRRRTIVETLQKEIGYYINRHNEVAKQYGISYQFSLPVIEDEDWYRTLDDIGMLAFFQGMPMGFEAEYYNNYAFGGAQVIKGDSYYIQADPGSTINYYHREECKLLTIKNLRFNSPRGCALEGAFPCDECKP
ncbi:MAG: hypothetical protein CVU84_06365 [Firmicutes bacterium HGW-Firmicutes-1]|jgi:hypothetical protein|nr:MAG: hypothetical protein CVU84_06365 [Firmicutes bacterium HGW-Firmicutes-1]